MVISGLSIALVAGIIAVSYSSDRANKKASNIRKNSLGWVDPKYSVMFDEHSLERIVFEVDQMSCYHMDYYIYKTFSELHGVKKVIIRNRRKEVTISYDPFIVSKDSLRNILIKNHFTFNEK